MSRKIGLAWPISSISGWGLVGFNLAIQLLRSARLQPVLLEEPDRLYIHGLQLMALLPIEMERRNRPAAKGLDFPVLHPLGNRFGASDSRRRFPGRVNVGRMVFEDAALDGPERPADGQYDLYLAACHWNAELLRAAGLPDVRMVHEGVDESLFHPAPAEGLAPGRFVVFSAGKLEFRKGQDIVVAAFRIFRQRHSDALLVLNWQNFWPQLAAGIETAGHVGRPPEIGQEGLKLTEWLIGEGLPEDAFVDLGIVPRALMAHVMREASVAVFPNRAEGATNMVALECMACGIPVVLSANTGHLDILAEDRCFPLWRQAPVRKPPPNFTSTAGWGESSVEELVEAMERVYTDRAEAARRGAAAAGFAKTRSWRVQAEQLIEAFTDLYR